MHFCLGSLLPSPSERFGPSARRQVYFLICLTRILYIYICVSLCLSAWRANCASRVLHYKTQLSQHYHPAASNMADLEPAANKDLLQMYLFAPSTFSHFFHLNFISFWSCPVLASVASNKWPSFGRCIHRISPLSSPALALSLALPPLPTSSSSPPSYCSPSCLLLFSIPRTLSHLFATL